MLAPGRISDGAEGPFGVRLRQMSTFSSTIAVAAKTNIGGAIVTKTLASESA